MIEIQAPNKVPENGIKVFLAGSIEMGNAEPWQERLVKEFENIPLTFLNPRRDDWDSSWVQSIENEQFNEQVNWELNGLEMADLVIIYFDPNTQSPITLLEFGLCAGLVKNMVVCCPDGFWRKGNVEIVCYKYAIPLSNSFEEMVYKIRKYVKIMSTLIA